MGKVENLRGVKNLGARKNLSHLLGVRNSPIKHTLRFQIPLEGSLGWDSNNQKYALLHTSRLQW